MSAESANAERPAVLRTPLCDLLGIDVPIVQTGMGWVSGARLTSATCAAGGLGILASATMTLDELKVAIGKVKNRTANPFGVNLLPNQADLRERIDLLVREGVRVASFAGAPSPEVVARLNDEGIVSIVTVGAKRHAEKMVKIGVKALIAQGGEGGGHTGSIPTSLLLPAVVDATDGSGVPVLGAGGFFDGRGLVAALAYGAQGIAMGTRFLLTRESHVPDHVKSVYLETPVTGTIVTSNIDGAPQRVIRTPMIESIESKPGIAQFPAAAINALRFARLSGTPLRDLVRSGLEMRKAQGLTWTQMALAANAPMMTRYGVVEGRLEAGILPTGQVVGAIEELPTVAELLERIMDEAAETLRRLGT